MALNKKGFLNYILKCNGLKSIKCSTGKKKKDTPNEKFSYNKQSGYKGYLETIALLSFLPKNATLEIKARLFSKGESPTGHRGKPFPSAALFSL